MMVIGSKIFNYNYLKAAGRGLLGLGVGAIVVATVAISLGAPVGIKYLTRTIYWSFLMSLLTFARMFVMLAFIPFLLISPGHPTLSGVLALKEIFAPVSAVFGSSWADWQRIFANPRPAGPIDFMVCLPAHGAILGAWFGAWPMPLDWEMPWQEWPICVTYGALAGYTTGMLASIIFIFAGSRKQHTKKE